ncbi:uncharacterized protein [Clytia hemisphaerica]|uniref:uncharacterized protein n=1 Tax=Clytia hemisphaerica TaxID=252671 RepID=UPI0034D53FF0
MLKSNGKFRKSLCIWRKKARCLIEEANTKEETVFQSYVQDLKDQIEFLKDEKSKLEEKIGSFLKDNEVQVFKDGKYSDEIRQVYEDLLCYGLGSRNIESVIRTVMSKLTGMEVGRLPKPSFAKYMLLEARALAQLQIADELTGGGKDIALDSNNTLQSVGTSKHRRSFITYDINTGNGKNLFLGLRESATGDAQTQLDVFMEVLNDIGKLDNNSQFLNQAIELWENLSEKERQSLSKVNEFFCGLHFLVALADQAEASLKIWENLCFPDGKVGSKQSGNATFFNSGESGVTRTVRTSFEIVNEQFENLVEQVNAEGGNVEEQNLVQQVNAEGGNVEEQNLVQQVNAEGGNVEGNIIVQDGGADIDGNINVNQNVGAGCHNPVRVPTILFAVPNNPVRGANNPVRGANNPVRGANNPGSAVPTILFAVPIVDALPIVVAVPFVVAFAFRGRVPFVVMVPIEGVSIPINMHNSNNRQTPSMLFIYC